MATTALGGTPARTVGELPAVGSPAPDAAVTRADLTESGVLPGDGRRAVLNIFPSLETAVCAASVRRFNQLAAGLDDTVVVCVSRDLPFTQVRFCGAEGIDDVEVASAFRTDFGEQYGVTLLDGPFAGLLARSVVVVSRDGTVLHTELAADIDDEPDYDRALAALERDR
jgi:thiol peroxidase